MAEKGPRRAHREGPAMIRLSRVFPDGAAAEARFEERRRYEGRCGVDSTDGAEFFRALPKRGCLGALRRLSEEGRSARSVREFTHRRDIRDIDAVARIGAVERGAAERLLRYRDSMARCG